MPIAKKNINADFLKQIKENTTKDKPEEDVLVQKSASSITTDTPSVEKKQEQKTVVEPQKEVSTAESKGDKYADVMNIRLSKGKRNEIKAFCSKNGVTITQYIESSFAFLSKEVAAGNIIISKGGISKVGE